MPSSFVTGVVIPVDGGFLRLIREFRMEIFQPQKLVQDSLLAKLEKPLYKSLVHKKPEKGFIISASLILLDFIPNAGLITNTCLSLSNRK